MSSDEVGANPTEYFYYLGNRIVEHHKDDGTGTLSLHRQYVYGLDVTCP